MTWRWRPATVLGPPQIALLAAIGRGTVRVRPRPRVVVLSTGSELVQPGEALTAGTIYDSNSFALAAAARDAGAIAYRVGAVADDADTLRSTIEDQLIRADLLVTTGGVSVGAYDVVKEALSSVGSGDAASGDAAGSGIDFRKLAMQPGKPQGFGVIGPDHTPLLALPGNPVSSYVSFELFVRPAIRALMGLPESEVRRPSVRAVLKADKALGSPVEPPPVPARRVRRRERHGQPGGRIGLPPDRRAGARRLADGGPGGRHLGGAGDRAGSGTAQLKSGRYG